MNEADDVKVVWRRRVASGAAIAHLAYLLIIVFLIADAIGITVGSISSAPSGVERLLMSYMAGGIVILLVIGLAIASPLLTWLTVLAVGLWRGRRWARIGGIVTFTLAAVVVGVTGIRSGVEVRGYVLMVLFASPALVGLVVLIRSAPAFAAQKNRRVSSSSAGAPSAG